MILSNIAMAAIKPISLNKSTVFILGAGASSPYGLPLGVNLKREMLGHLSNSACQQILTKLEFPKSLVDDFFESLSGTYHPTIDIFLEKKKKFRSLGSYLIAYTLLPLEKHNALFPQSDWYGHLYNVINFEDESPHADKIKFVSLNYDRSLEHFLTKNIHYNCPDYAIENANAKLGHIQIIHAHGSLGPYPQIPYGNKSTDIYGPGVADAYGNKSTDASVLRTAANRILIVSDNIQDSDDFKNAQLAISEASNLVIIGFGYDLTTLKILIPPATNLGTKRILGTAFNLDQSLITQVTEFFNDKIEIAPATWDANRFLRYILPVKS